MDQQPSANGNASPGAGGKPLFEDEFPEPEFTADEALTEDGSFTAGQVIDPGDIIDAEIVDEPETKPRAITAPREPRQPRDADAKAPDIDEWLDFFSRIVFRILTNWYISFAFRGIDADDMSDRDVERVKLTKDERDQIARPFAEFANKSKAMRKRGRMIVAASDSIDSFYTLTLWAARVNHVARKYRPNRPEKGTRNVRHSRQAPANGQRNYPGEGIHVVNPGNG